MATFTRTADARAILYTRVSLDRRDTGRSVAEQETDLRATSAREGWVIVDVFTDNDRSASRYAKKARPAYGRLVAAVASGRCDIVAVWELSRLSRDLGTLIAFRDLCRDHGVTWSLGGRMYDPADDRDTLPIIVAAAQAEGESGQTSKRVRRAMNANALRGRPHGRHLYGYRREYDPTTKAFVRQVVDDDRAAVLHEIAERFLAGESFYSIARDMTVRGVPSPAGGATWHPTNCARLLKNPAYAGLRAQRGQIVADAEWPAMFAPAVWSQIRSKLDDPSRLTRKESAVRHLLTNLAVCGACGSDAMTTMKHKSGNRSYMCKACFGVSRSMVPTDAHVEAEIVARLAAPDLADLFGQADRQDGDAETARATASEIRKRLADFEDQAGSGAVSAAAFGRIEARLSAELEAAEMAARRASAPPAVRHLAGVDPARVAAVWAAMSVAEKREAMRAMGAVVTILPTGRGRRIFDPATVTVDFD